MKIGYARVSTTKQDLTRQVNWLESLGCDIVFTDKVSGTVKGNQRKGMSDLLKSIRPGDTLYLDEMSRLGRTFLETINTLYQLLDKGVEIVLNKEKMTLSKDNPIGNMIANILIVFAEMENQYKKERAAHALRVAKENGRGGGRPAGYSKNALIKAKMCKALYEDKSHNLTVKEMCSKLNISRATFYRHLAYLKVVLDKDK